MKKLVCLFSAIFVITACGDEEKTVYDYLNDEPLLSSTLTECTSGKLNNELRCENVKRAYAYLDVYKQGLLTEDKLKKLGKK